MSRQKTVFRVIAEPLALAAILAAVVRAAVSLYAIPSASMLPALAAGDHILVTPYRLDAPARGDVVVFRAPYDPSTLMVKRIVGVPGDLIDSRAGHVRIGQRTIAEPYVLHQGATGSIPAQLVPPDSFFVMGDNREDSADSRRWGAVRRDLVVGRVRMVLWSSAPAGGERTAGATTVSAEKQAMPPLRLSRIFKCVE
jgi:signal peptidase I